MPVSSSSDATGPTTIPVRQLATPVFAQPEPTPDPSTFKIKHPSDNAAYKVIDQLNAEHKINPLPFPLPRGGNAEPQLNLTQVFGHTAAVKRIQTTGQIVFHATGDCGSTRGPRTQNEVTDKMTGDFIEPAPSEVPQFALLHTRQQTVYTANDLGMPAQAKAARSLLQVAPRRLRPVRRAKGGR